MPANVFRAKASVWLYPGNGGWHFVTLPKKTSADIKKRFGDKARGWGSLPVRVTVGKTMWRTSVFPDRKAGAYLLALKASVRNKEDIGRGDAIILRIEVMV